MRDLLRPHLISQVLESGVVANSLQTVIFLASIQPFPAFFNETRKNEGKVSGVKSKPRPID